MLDIGWTELLVIAVVLIVVVGPKDLPPMLRAFGKMTSNLRKMAGDFRTQFDQALREADMDDVRQTLSDAQRLNPANALREAMNPLREMGNEIRNDLQKATTMPPLNEIGRKPEDETAESLIDELLPVADMSLPETPPMGVTPLSAPAAAPASTPVVAAASVVTPAAPASTGPAVTPAPAAAATAPTPVVATVTETPVPAVKKPRAPRKPPAAVEEAPIPVAAAKRTRTAKSISAAAIEATPSNAPPLEKAPRKRVAKSIEASAELATSPVQPRKRKKPTTPKDDA
nr:Sec-independent protein translocase protein TatB [Rhizobium sp. FY34]